MSAEPAATVPYLSLVLPAEPESVGEARRLVREFAAKHGVSETEALKKGMEVKSVEFVKQGGEIYSKQ